ncbi:MAG: macro domain-containing protein [Gemmatimonadaceae bacterium]
MISYVQGNLFESPAQTLVNTVNTVGAMGKGIALQFKRYFPEMFTEYQRFCEAGKLQIGTLHLYQTRHKKILNFPTKQEWRRPSKLEYVERGLDTFVRIWREAGIHSIAFPPLGCGNGELSYDDVRPLMERYLSNLPIPVFLYPPLPRNAVPEHRAPATIRDWLHAEPRALPLAEVWEDIKELLAQPREFHTITKQTTFVAEFVPQADPSQEYIRVRSSGKTFAVPRDDVLPVWRELSSHGVVTPRAVDERVAPYLFPIFAALPYIGVVRVARTFDDFSFNKMNALQLVPSVARDEQRGLSLA